MFVHHFRKQYCQEYNYCHFFKTEQGSRIKTLLPDHHNRTQFLNKNPDYYDILKIEHSLEIKTLTIVTVSLLTQE